MPTMVKRLLPRLLLALSLALTACGGGSDDPQQPAPALSESTAISETEAVEAAEIVAVDQGLSTEGLRVNPAQIFGEWHVSFEPIDSDSLLGGYLVVLDAQTGEMVDLLKYQ